MKKTLVLGKPVVLVDDLPGTSGPIVFGSLGRHRINPVIRYRTILADPPWDYGDKLRQSATKRSAADHYPTLDFEGICRFPERTLAPGPGAETIAAAILPEAFLWLWVTNPMLLDGSGAAVCRRWGFVPKQLVTWTKGRLETVRVPCPSCREDALCACGGSGLAEEAQTVLNIGMGRVTRGVTEHMILATRGRYSHLVMAKGVPNWFLAPRGRHSAKPERAFEIVEATTPGPYLELFARTRRPGWDAVGNQLGD